jgi:hypothetical protein
MALFLTLNVGINMGIIGTTKQIAISAFVGVLGHGEIFTRIISEIERTNEGMPNATGADKRHKVLADLGIILEDTLESIGENILRILLELAVAWVKDKAE